MYTTNFTMECARLHHIWSLDPEFGNEHHDWTVPLNDDGLSAIFLPDLRPGEEGKKIEVRFCFGCVAVPPTLKALEAVITVVPECCEPYRPFNVPPVWVDPTKQYVYPVGETVGQPVVIC
jgi:hypothetical protein